MTSQQFQPHPIIIICVTYYVSVCNVSERCTCIIDQQIFLVDHSFVNAHTRKAFLFVFQIPLDYRTHLLLTVHLTSINNYVYNTTQ